MTRRPSDGPNAPTVDGDHGVPEGTAPGDAAEGDQLGAEAASGILWTTAQKWVIRVAGVATLAILTRLVAPADFGVVAAATTFLPFFYLLSDAFSTFIVQASRIDQRMLSTSLWFSLTASLALLLLSLLAAPLVSTLMGIEDLTPVLRVLSVSVVVSALASVPTALLRRRLAFRTLAVQGVVAAGVAQIVAVVMAVGGLGAWALVAQLLVMQSIAMVLAWKAAGWRPELGVSASMFREIGTFGARVSAAEFISAVAIWAQAAIVASTLGATVLGYLSIAQRLVWVVQDLSASAVKPVSVVVFARVREAPERLRAGYVRALSTAYAVVGPLLTVVAVTAPMLIPLLFGGKWEPSVPVAQALAIAAIFTLGAMLDQGLIYGLGRPGVWLRYALIVDAVTVAVIAAVVQRGLTAVGVGFLAVAAGATAVRSVVVGRAIAMPLPTVFSVHGRMLVMTALSGGLGALTLVALPPQVPLAVGVAVPALVIGLVSLVWVRVVQPDVLMYAIRTLPLPGSISGQLYRLLLLSGTDGHAAR